MTDQQKYINKLAGDRVLIIGGSSGIGYGVAEACVEHKCTVLISASSPESASKALKRLQDSYPSATDRIIAYSCNLGDEATLESNIVQLFKDVTKDGTEKLDHIIFTAGDALFIRNLQGINLDNVKQAGMIRFFAPLLVAKHSVPHFNPGPKSSYTITSGTISQRPQPDWTVVGAYAGGHHSMARGLALDMRPVRVNTVVPGAVDTELWKMSEEQKQTFFANLVKRTATGKIATPEEVAQTYIGVLLDRNATGSIFCSNSGVLLS